MTLKLLNFVCDDVLRAFCHRNNYGYIDLVTTRKLDRGKPTKAPVTCDINIAPFLSQDHYTLFIIHNNTMYFYDSLNMVDTSTRQRWCVALARLLGIPNEIDLYTYTPLSQFDTTSCGYWVLAFAYHHPLQSELGYLQMLETNIQLLRAVEQNERVTSTLKNLTHEYNAPTMVI